MFSQIVIASFRNYVHKKKRLEGYLDDDWNVYDKMFKDHIAMLRLML